jgi:hypothetical protein
MRKVGWGQIHAQSAMIVVLLATGCATPPEWWLGREMDAGHEAETSNRTATIQALEAGREVSRRVPASQPEPRGGEGGNAIGPPWYSIGPRDSVPSVPSVPSHQQSVWPQAQIVSPPKAPATALSRSAPDQMSQPVHPVPPFTTILRSPHPGTRCFPDSFAGQRCFSQP